MLTDEYLGAPLVGIIISAVIYGITCLQVYLYYTEHCLEDRLFLKSFVAFLVTIDTLHMGLVCYFIYHYGVTDFGRLVVVIGRSEWSLEAQTLPAVVNIFCVQLFWMHRIYQLSGKRNQWIIPTAGILELGHFTGAIGYLAIGIISRRSHRTISYFPWIILALITHMSCDLLTTVLTIFYLYRMRIHSSRTTRGVNLLIIYTVNTGLLVTLFMIITVVFACLKSTANIDQGAFIILARLYSTSCLSTLNSREHIRSVMEPAAPTTPKLSRFRARAAEPTLEDLDSVTSRVSLSAFEAADKLQIGSQV